MEAAYREGEEWLEQLLEYISGNFDFIKEYCDANIPKIKPYFFPNITPHNKTGICIGKNICPGKLVT